MLVILMPTLRLGNERLSSVMLCFFLVVYIMLIMIILFMLVFMPILLLGLAGFSSMMFSQSGVMLMIVMPFFQFGLERLSSMMLCFIRMAVVFEIMLMLIFVIFMFIFIFILTLMLIMLICFLLGLFAKLQNALFHCPLFSLHHAGTVNWTLSGERLSMIFVIVIRHQLLDHRLHSL